MRASVLERFGDPMIVRNFPTPATPPGNVLVRVAASGVNPLDVKIREGRAPHAQIRLPAILGMDLAGIVESVGTGVDGFEAGDEIFGLTGGVGALPGSLCDSVAVDARLIAIKPPSLTMREAAAIPLAFITAWEGLVDRAKVSTGQRVLIHGGAGGVGNACVQLAIARGARVFATGSAKNLDVIARSGATPIDHAATSVEDYVAAHTGGDGFDIVYDTVGGAVLDASFEAVKTYEGRVVSALGWGSHSLAPLSFRGASYSGVFTLLPMLTGNGRAHHGDILREAAKLAERGAFRPRVDPTEFTLDRANEAHDYLKGGANEGKVIVGVNL